MGCCAHDDELSSAASWMPKALVSVLIVTGVLIGLVERMHSGSSGPSRNRQEQVGEGGRLRMEVVLASVDDFWRLDLSRDEAFSHCQVDQAIWTSQLCAGGVAVAPQFEMAGFGKLNVQPSSAPVCSRSD